MDKKNYIKEHSWSGFKSGVKYSSYIYLGATIASLLISLAVVPIFPFTLLISNPVTWAMLGVAFVGLSAAAVSVASPLFHWAKDYINQKKVEKQEEKGEERAVDENKKQLEPVLDPEIESPSSINQRKVKKKKEKVISNCKTSDDNLGTPSIKTTTRIDAQEQGENPIFSLLENSIAYSEFMEKTNQGGHKFWLDYTDIIYIAYNAYGYLPSQVKNDVYFFVCKPEFVSGRIPDSELDQKGRFFSNGELLTDRELALELRDYKETVKRKPGLVFTSIINVSDHYVTLVVAYDSKNKNFRAYYCSSFDSPYNEIEKKLPEYLEREFHLEKKNIKIRYTGQQKKDDNHNCGIYALENAKKITDMMKAGRSLAEIDKELAKYQPSEEELKNKRIESLQKELKRIKTGKGMI